MPESQWNRRLLFIKGAKRVIFSGRVVQRTLYRRQILKKRTCSHFTYLRVVLYNSIQLIFRIYRNLHWDLTRERDAIVRLAKGKNTKKELVGLSYIWR